jgi:alanyl-tRNA synthetase
MFGLKIYNLSINEVAYSPEVEEQIKVQQKAIMEVQTAVANSKRAEQEALTTVKQGEANAAKAKWEQETIKAKAVTEAQQQLEVATLATKAAEQFKLAETLKGEGEAARRKLVMEADGALDKKLAAYTEVSKAYADAIAKYTGHWVPNIIMGGTGTGANQTAQNGATDLINLLTINAAKQLSLDMSLPQTAPVAAAKK